MVIQTLTKQVNRLFQQRMMQAPPLALDIQFYKDCLEQSVNYFKSQYPDEIENLDAIQTQMEEEFLWFDPEPKEGVGGHFRNMNSPRKLTMQEMHEVLGITDKPKEQIKANELYGYTE